MLGSRREEIVRDLFLYINLQSRKYIINVYYFIINNTNLRYTLLINYLMVIKQLIIV